MPLLHHPSGNGCADQVLILGETFLQIATTDKPGAINPSIFSCLGLFFPRNYYSGLFHHLYTGLSNGGCINNGGVVVRSVSIYSSANAASGTQTGLRIRAWLRLHRVTSTPCIDMTSTPGHISFNKLFLRKAIILFGPHYFMCVGDRLRPRHVVSSASRCCRPNQRKSARIITLLVVLPYRRVRLPRGLRHRQESSTSSSVRCKGHISFITHFA